MSGISSHAQQKEVYITESYESVALASVLRSYKKKHGVRFAYDADLIRDKLVTASFNNTPIQEVVKAIIADESLESSWTDNTCIIKPMRLLTNFAISGTISDEYSGEVLPFANVFLKNTRKGTSTNTDGYFTLTSIPSDTSWIVVNYLGYKPSEFRVKDIGKTYGVQLSLEAHTEVLEEVIIDETSPMVRPQKNIGQMTINPTKLSALPSLGEQDVFRTLQLLPGIGGTDETSSGLVIRNNSPDQNLILFDGISLYHIDHFYGIFSALNSKAIKDVQIFKAGFLPKYGGRSGAIVDITGKSGNTKRKAGSLGINMISSNIVFEAPIGDRVNIFIAGRRSYTDIIETNLYKNLFDNVLKSSQTNANDEEIDLSISPNFFFYDFNSKVSYRPSKKDIVSFSIYQGKDKLDLNTVEDYDGIARFELQEDVNWGNKGYGVKWGRQWNKRYYTNLQMGYSKYFSKLEAANSLAFLPDSLISDNEDDFLEIFKETVSQDNNVTDVTLRWSNEWTANDQHVLTFGTDFNQNRVTLRSSYEGFEYQNDDNSGWQLAGYFQDQVQVTDRLSLLMGLRGMYYNVTQSSFIEPRVNTTYRISDAIRLKAGWGKNNQVINRVIREDVYASNPDFWVLADEEFIPSVSSSSIAAGFTYEKGNFLIDAEVYTRDTEGILEYVPRLTNIQPGSAATNDAYYEGINTAKGLEMLFQKKTGVHSGWISYTWSKSDNEFDELNGGIAFPSQYDQRHELKLVNMIEFGNWELSANWVYGSGKPFTPASGDYEIALLDGTNIDLVSYSDINADRLPAYHRMDVSATYSFDIGNAKAQIGGSILNLYNRGNVKFKKLVPVYFDEENESDRISEIPTYELRDVKLLGFTPNIYFNIQF